jgi:hypothetical protein
MKVILDTNIIFSDFHLKGAKIKSLCESVKLTGDTVHIPKVVVDESVNKYWEKILECKLVIDREMSNFKRLTGRVVGDNPISKEFTLEEFRQYKDIFEKRLRELGINIIPYPSISHQELVKRDLARKKPFQETGKGYRDALIWESVKSICEESLSLFENPKIIFVNKNHKDFCEKGLLHPDLKEDLVNNGINEDDVRVIEDIEIFIREYIKPKQKILKKIQEKLNTNKQHNKIDLNTEINNRITDFLLHREFDHEESPFRQEFENPFVADLGEPSFTVTEVRQISEEKILVEVEVEVNCYFDFFIFKSDAICMEEDELPYIWDSDWNKHYMAASKAMPVRLKVTLIVNSSFEEILSDNIEITYNHQ